MKKIIFGGICMLSGLLGIFITIYAASYPLAVLGSTERKDLLDFLYEKGLYTIFFMFCCLGIIGLLFGVWGVFENDRL